MPIKKLSLKTLKLLLVLSIQVICICLAVEVGLRILQRDFVPPGSDQPKIWQYHPTYGWIGQPNIDVQFRHPAFSIKVKHNALGQRDIDYPQSRSDKKRMLVIGDSFTWGYGVESQSRFTEIIDNKYPEWEIINAGIAGTGTDQQYLYLKDMIAHYQPDAVMILVIQNDFQDNMRNENHNYYKPYFTLESGQLIPQQIPVPKPRLEQTLQRYIYGRSYFFNFANTLFQFAKGATAKALSIEVEEYRAYRGFKFRDSHPIMQALLNAMIDTAQQHKAEFIIIHGQMLDGLQAVLREVASRRNVIIHNLDRAFVGYQHADYQIPGDAHWNTLGHKLVAKDLELFLLENAIFSEDRHTATINKRHHLKP